MDCDVAVLGGGPGGYTAAIRAAQLGAKAVCIEKEPELGGTCLRVGCIPTKAWVQTAFAIKEASETFGKLGVQVGSPQLDFGAANQWKDGVVKQMTRASPALFKANGVEWVKGIGRFKDANTISVEGGEDVTLQDRGRRDGLVPASPADRRARLGALRRLDRAPRPDRGAAPARRARRRHHRLRVRVDLPPLRLRGDDHRDAAEADPGRGRRRGRRAREALRQARDHAPSREAVHEGRGDGRRIARALRRRRDGRCRPDARRRRAWAARRGPRARGDRRRARPAEGDRRGRAPADDRPAHLCGRRLRRLLAARAHRVPRGRGRGRERDGPRGGRRQPRRAAPDLHRSGDRGRGADRGARRASSTATTSRPGCSRGSRTRGP